MNEKFEFSPPERPRPFPGRRVVTTETFVFAARLAFDDGIIRPELRLTLRGVETKVVAHPSRQNRSYWSFPLEVSQ
jgi:hypothetical protein